MTLRFFPLIVSAVQFVIIAGLTDYLGVGGFLSTMFAESIVSVLSAIVQFVVKLMPAPQKVA